MLVLVGQIITKTRSVMITLVGGFRIYFEKEISCLTSRLKKDNH